MKTRPRKFCTARPDHSKKNLHRVIVAASVAELGRCGGTFYTQSMEDGREQQNFLHPVKAVPDPKADVLQYVDEGKYFALMI